MTFTFPDDLATLFLHRVPARERSRYVAEALAAKLQEHAEQMIRSCEVANRQADVLSIEQDWDEMRDKADRIEEPWDIAPKR